MTSPDGVRDEVRGIVLDVFELEPGEVEDAADFELHLGVDSLRKLELVAELENRYGIRFDRDAVLKMTSIDRAVAATEDALRG